MNFRARGVRLPNPAPAEVAAAAEIVRRHLHEMLKADCRVRDRQALRAGDHPRVLSAYRVMEALTSQGAAQ